MAWKTLKYYESEYLPDKGYYNNYLTEISGDVEFIKNHMGGNYGFGEEYLVRNKEGQYQFIYYGDGSAYIKKLK